MTWLGGPTYADWECGPYGLTGHGTDYSWDLYPYWVHMANWGSLGISYPWGCLGIKGEKVVIRIASNGYWDTCAPRNAEGGFDVEQIDGCGAA